MTSSRAGGRRRVLVVALAVVAATLGLPGPGRAAGPFGPIPKTVETFVRGPDSLDSGSRFARTLVLPLRANLVAVSWRSADAEARGVAVRVRPHTAHGWEAWTAMGVNADEGPDVTKHDRVFTEPLWVGTAERLRIDVRTDAEAARLRSIRIHLINSKGDATRPNVVVRALRAVGRFLDGRPSEAMTSQPLVITRRQWGADERVRDQSAPRITPTIQIAFVHHTAGTNSYTRSESDDVVRAIYRYHVRTRDFRDIGYNFLVDRYGRVFEGRWGGIDLAVVGAHTKGFNFGSTGMALMGTFTSAAPPAAMVRGLERLIAWKLDVHHVPPVGLATLVSGGSDKYSRGTKVRLNRISGHRDAQLTACPGTRTYRLLPTIRSAVNGIGNPKIFLPALPPTLLRPDGDGIADTFALKATFTGTLAWTLTVSGPGGAVARTWTGAGSSMTATWDGTGVDALTRVPTGAYTWRLSARDSSGAVAREATGAILVVTDHPNGTVLDDGSRRIVIEAGKGRAVDPVAWQSRYPTMDLVTTGPGEIDRLLGLGTVAPVAVREGTLLKRASDGAYFVFTGGAARPLDANVFTALGYADQAAIPVADDYIASLAPGPAVTDTSTHPQGSVVRDPAGAIWMIEAGLRKPMSPLVLSSRYRAVEVVAALPGDLSLPAGEPTTLREGALLLLADGTRWIVSDATRRRFADVPLFDAMGYKPAWLLRASDQDVATIPAGPQIG